MITNIIQSKTSAPLVNGAQENGKKTTFAGFSQLLALMAGCIPNESTDSSTSGKSMKGLLPKFSQDSSPQLQSADAPGEALKIFEIMSNSPDISNDYITTSHVAPEYINIKGGESHKPQIPHQMLTQLMRFIMTSDATAILNNKSGEDTVLIDHVLNPLQTSQSNEIKSLLAKYASELNIESVHLQLPNHASIKQVSDRGIRKGFAFKNKDIIQNKALQHINSDMEKIKVMPEDLGQRLLKINQIKINQKGDFNGSSVPEINSALLDHALNIEKYSITRLSESLPQFETTPDMLVQEVYKTYHVNIDTFPLSSIMQATIKESLSSTHLQEQSPHISQSAQSPLSASTLKTSENAALLSGREEEVPNLSGLLTKSNKEITHESQNRAQSIDIRKTPSLSNMDTTRIADTDKSALIPEIKEQMVPSTDPLSETTRIETTVSEITTDVSDLQTQSTENVTKVTNASKSGEISDMAVEFPAHSDKQTFTPDITEQTIKTDTAIEGFANADKPLVIPELNEQVIDANLISEVPTIKEQMVTADTAVEGFANADKPAVIPQLKEQVINADTISEVTADSDKPFSMPVKEQKVNSDMRFTLQERPIESAPHLSDTTNTKTKGELIENARQSNINIDSCSSDLQAEPTENTAQVAQPQKMGTTSDMPLENSIQTDKPTGIPEQQEQVINLDSASEIQEQPITFPDKLSEAAISKTQGESIGNVSQADRQIDSCSSDLQAPVFISKTNEQPKNPIKSSEINEHSIESSPVKSHTISDQAAEIPIQADKSTVMSEINEHSIESGSHKILSHAPVSEPHGSESQGQSIENATQSSTMNKDSSGFQAFSTENTTPLNTFTTIQNQTIPSPEIQEQPIMRSTLSNLKKLSPKPIEGEGKSPDDLMQSIKSDNVSESNPNKSTQSVKEQNITTNAPKQTKGIHYNQEGIKQAIKNPQASENLKASENTTGKEHGLAIDTTNQEHSSHRQSAPQSIVENSIEKIPDSRELKPAADTNVLQPQIIKGPKAKNSSEPLTSHINTTEIDQGNITELVNKTLHLFKSNESDVKIQLRPKEFGRMQMHINQNENSINLEIITENIVAKNMIEGYLPELKAALLEHGLHLTNHTIITGNPKYEQRKEDKNNDRYDKNQKKYPKNAKKSRVSKTNKTGSFTI